MKLNHILEQIGHTPHLNISRFFGGKHEVWLKLERTNPGGSIKDRIALSMIEAAEREGLLHERSVIVEPTSGNTGVGLAMVAAVKGYRLILVMPESMSMERRALMAAYGAEFELTPAELGMKGAIERAKELVRTLPEAWMPMQFENPANVQAHKQFTAIEILNDFPEGLDVLVSGVGTGGHITGVAEVLKATWKNLKVWAVEPETSAVLSGEKPGPHSIQGIGAGFVPSILNRNLLDGIIKVGKDEAFQFARNLARSEGVLVGISTGAALAAVNHLLKEFSSPKRVLTFNYDTGERYLSVEGLFV